MNHSKQTAKKLVKKLEEIRDLLNDAMDINYKIEKLDKKVYLSIFEQMAELSVFIDEELLKLN